MYSKIQMSITVGCDFEGKGGTVVDNAAVVIPNEEFVGLLAAFKDSYPIPQVATGNKIKDDNGNEVDEMKPQFSDARWLSICLRNHSNIVADGYRARMIDAQAAQTKQALQKASAEKQVIVVEVGDPVASPEVIN